MRRLRLALELFFQRQMSHEDDSAGAVDQMSCEIKGSVMSLLTLFFLVSLLSYLPLDTIYLQEKNFDSIHNLGGIVGAFIGEWFLGNVGVVGYSIVLLLGFLSIQAFQAIPIKNNFFRIIGVALGTILTATTLYLLLGDQYPDDSLFVGGRVGHWIGLPLRHYFNSTGALLVVAAGYVITLILTTGFSITGTVSALFSQKEEEDSDEEESEGAVVVPLRKNVPAPTPKAKRTRKKKAKATDDEEGSDESTDEPSEEDGDEGDSDGDTEAASGEFKFQEIIPFTGAYSLPSLRLLKNAEGNPKKLSKGELKENAEKLCEHLLSFEITGEVVAISQGPVLITYEFKPSAGIKLSRIAALQDDLGVVLGTRELRVIAPIPGKTVVGIEVPRPKVETIPLKELLAEDDFYDKKIKIPVTLGKATDGSPVFGDLAAMPHLLVAGATGSGKSVFVNSLIMSFLYRLTPQQLRLILVDPKMLELSVFDGIPHLITNVITDNTIAFNALTWCVQEMERRYGLMATTNSKNLESYNSKVKGTDKMPFIVVVVDELADLMMSGGKDAEVAITRLAQKARAAGIHLVIATQRPSTDVVTGLIKANIPSRLSFKVPSGIDSRTVLDTGGAEDLIGKGDSLMVRPAVPLQRLHGTFVTEDELARVVKYVKDGKNFSKYYIDFSGKPKKD